MISISVLVFQISLGEIVNMIWQPKLNKIHIKMVSPPNVYIDVFRIDAMMI